MKLLNLFLWPLGIFLELIQEDLILNGVFPETLLNLLCTLDSMADDDSRDWALNSFGLLISSGFLLFDKRSINHSLALSWADPDGSRCSTTVCFSQFLCTCKCSCMLLKGCLGSFEEEGVYTFVEVLACHIVVNNAEPGDEYGSSIFWIDVVFDLGELTFLLNDFDWLSSVLAGFCSFLVCDNWLLKLFVIRLVKNSLLFPDSWEAFMGWRRCQFLVILFALKLLQCPLEVELWIDFIEWDIAAQCLRNKMF